jgi:hypothetical protein
MGYIGQQLVQKCPEHLRIRIIGVRFTEGPLYILPLLDLNWTIRVIKSRTTKRDFVEKPEAKKPL